MFRKGVKISLVFLLLAVSLILILFVPDASVNRLQAVPAYAELVYNESHPDWFTSFFPSLSGQDGIFSGFWQSHFERIQKRPLAVAAVSTGFPGERKTWIAVSELDGPLALMTRWMLFINRPESVSPVRPYAAWKVWKLEHPDLPSWARVRFVVTDGLLICSVSPDSRDIYRLIDTVDRRSVSMVDRRRP
jgi:hypothetical protein